VQPDNTVSPVRKVLIPSSSCPYTSTSFLPPDAPEDDDPFHSVKFPCSVPPLRDLVVVCASLWKKSRKKKRNPHLSAESALVSGFGPALGSRESVLPAPCLVVRSRFSPSHRLTHPPMSDRTASCAHRKPHGRGGSGFHIPDSPSVTSGVFPRQGGGRASINSTR
jgi:hypothetical protein